MYYSYALLAAFIEAAKGTAKGRFKFTLYCDSVCTFHANKRSLDKALSSIYSAKSPRIFRNAGGGVTISFD